MTSLALLLLQVSCPEGLAFDDPAQQDSACALLEQRPASSAVDRAALQRLLDEPEFSRVRHRNGNIFAVLWERFLAWLKQLFESRGAASFARAVPFFVLALALAVTLFAVLRLRGLGRARASRGQAAEPSRLVLAPPPEHLAAARRLLGTDPRQAIREALLALLSSLERRNLARPDRVKTNREVVDEMPGRGAAPGLVDEVRARVQWFDRAFYSLAQVDSADAVGFVDGVERIIA